MKLLIAISVFCYAVGCKREPLEIQRSLNDVTLFGITENWIFAQQVPVLVSRKDTLELIKQIAPYFQNYDSVIVEKCQPKLPPVFGDSLGFYKDCVYSVTNDSAVYVLAFFSPTIKDTEHEIFLSTNHSVDQIAQ